MLSLAGKFFHYGLKLFYRQKLCFDYWEDRFLLLGSQSLNVRNYVSTSGNITVLSLIIFRFVTLKGIFNSIFFFSNESGSGYSYKDISLAKNRIITE